MGARAAQPVAGGEHRNHLRQQRRGQCGGDPRFAPQLDVRGSLARAIRRALGGSVATEDRVVAGALDRIEQLPRLDRGGKRGRRRFGREIDAGFDTGDAAQRLFDTSRAGGAGHPFEGDLDPASGFRRRNGKRGIHRSMVYPRWVYVKRCAAKGAG